MAPVALGIVGYGIMGERLLRAAVNHDQAVLRLAGVWDPSQAALERLAAEFPDVPRLGSAAEVLAASDCLYVASPPLSHLDHAGAAFAAGRAVFCEKPLAVDVAAARALVAAARSTGGRAGVNFPFASSFAVEQLVRWIEEGVVGEPVSLTIEVGFAAWPRPWQVDAASWLDRPAQGGFTREVISHFLFLARRLLGPLELREAEARFPGEGASERSVRARLAAGGLEVRLTGGVGTTEKPDHNLWVLEGSAGAVRLRDWSFAERRAADGTWHEAPDAMPNERARPLVLKRQLDKVAAMTRGEPHRLASLEEALEVQETVEAILAARRDG
ncbi:Gfo/Idh/MocA family oxidoreductase [Geminicoccaceae bacterium 1502E]|nr:Gfo/Idh/MocA family oxidoreductase [Geminicoccaceae bacterium 1502E]